MAQLKESQFKFPVAYQALMFDNYIDNVFLTAPDVETLVQGITEIEMVEAKGDFIFEKVDLVRTRYS